MYVLSHGLPHLNTAMTWQVTGLQSMVRIPRFVTDGLPSIVDTSEYSVILETRFSIFILQPAAAPNDGNYIAGERNYFSVYLLCTNRST